MKEVDATIKSHNEVYINTWEQVRFIRNTIGVCMGVKLPKLDFPWDKEDEIKKEVISPEELQIRKQVLIDIVNKKK